jgi:uncharacterized protein (DUF934 family)
MATLFKDGSVVADDWQAIAEDAPVPASGAFIVSLKRWRAERSQLAQSEARLGVRIEAAEAIEDSDDFSALALAVLPFPKFTDGRSYSKARALRERLGFTGEIRATGDVLIDQVPLMLRCGFDAFEVTNQPTLRALQQGALPAIPETYQSTGRDRAGAWSRRCPTLCAAG